MTSTRENRAELMLPALVTDSRVLVRYDVESLGELRDCWECTKHPPPDYLTGGAPLPRGVWRINYIRGDQDGYLDVCGRWCSDWALAGLLSDPIFPATKIVLHVHAELRVAPPRPRRAAAEGPQRCTSTTHEMS